VTDNKRNQTKTNQMTETNLLTNTLNLLEENLKNIKPLYEVRDRLRACVIQMGEGDTDAFLRRREDGAMDFFGNAGTCLRFALTGPESEKAKKILEQVRRDNPASSFYLCRFSTAVERSYKRTQELIKNIRPLAEAQNA
jgi:hypothetical protein